MSAAIIMQFQIARCVYVCSPGNLHYSVDQCLYDIKSKKKVCSVF